MVETLYVVQIFPYEKLPPAERSLRKFTRTGSKPMRYFSIDALADAEVKMRISITPLATEAGRNDSDCPANLAELD